MIIILTVDTVTDENIGDELINSNITGTAAITPAKPLLWPPPHGGFYIGLP